LLLSTATTTTDTYTLSLHDALPIFEGAVVTAEVVEHGRGKKVIAFKKRRRQNSKRSRGHRQHNTTVRIVEIAAAGGKAKKASKKDRKSTRLNSSHVKISYAVFCLKK